MLAGVQADESNGSLPSKTFIVWIVLEKPHRYLYDRLWKNLNPGVVLFFRHVDQPDKRDVAKREKADLPPGQYIRRGDEIDAVFHEAFVAAKELQVRCSITVVEASGPEVRSIRTGPVQVI
jgi:hypothetical protein